MENKFNVSTTSSSVDLFKTVEMTMIIFTYYGIFRALNGPFMGKLVSSHRG